MAWSATCSLFLNTARDWRWLHHLPGQSIPMFNYPFCQCLGPQIRQKILLLLKNWASGMIETARGFEERPQRQHVHVWTSDPLSSRIPHILVPAARLQALSLILLNPPPQLADLMCLPCLQWKLNSSLTFSPALGIQSPIAPLYICLAHLAGFGTCCISLRAWMICISHWARRVLL